MCVRTVPALPALVPKGGWMRALLESMVVLLCTPNWHTRGAQQGQILPVTGEDVK